MIDYQFGFWKRYFSILALIAVLDQIYYHLDNNKKDWEFS